MELMTGRWATGLELFPLGLLKKGLLVLLDAQEG